MKILKPTRVTRSYTQLLNAPPEKVFPLLCPVREADWVPGWNPALVLTNTGAVEPDCIFTTHGPQQDAIWIVTHHDPQHHRLEMLKVTPDHTVGKIEIALAATEDGKTAAGISYTFTAIGPAGVPFLQDFTEAWYRGFMERWEKALNHYLATGNRLPG